MRLFCKVMFLVTGLLYIINVGSGDKLGVGIHMMTIAFEIVAGYLYLKPDAIVWFGSKLSRSHDASKTVSYIMCSFILMGPLLFNLGPIAIFFDL